ncbi:MAG: phage tail tape measure protein [Paracoccaceae bacterium]
MSQFDGLDNLDMQVSALEATLGDAAVVAASFNEELRTIRTTLSGTQTDVATLEKGLSRGLRKAFDSAVFDGARLSDVLREVAQTMANTAYNQALKPVTDQVGSTIAQGIGSLVGAAMPFGNTGLFGGGKNAAAMGYDSAASSVMSASERQSKTQQVAAPVSVVMNISTPDAASFQRSQAQIAAEMSRALSRGQRNR